jgi:hypothetical protein
MNAAKTKCVRVVHRLLYKLESRNLRNIFDQYSQPENRITHALMTAINEDRRLLGCFLRELVKVKPPAAPETLNVLEEQYPGEDEPSGDEVELRGVPDGWIFTNDGWCIIIESKVLAKLYAVQLRNHLTTARRRGFKHVTLVAIVVQIPSSIPANTLLLEWKTVYAWLRQHGRLSKWADKTAEYLEVMEAKMIDSQKFVEGSLTEFAGFPFSDDRPFTYIEGRRLLRLAIEELKKRHDLKKHLGMNPKVMGRKAITGRQIDAVWDFLSLSKAKEEATFTKYPHLTLELWDEGVSAMLTVPDKVNNSMRQN